MNLRTSVWTVALVVAWAFPQTVNAQTSCEEGATLQSPTAENKDRAGYGLALEGDWAMTGAYLHDSAGVDAGVLHVWFWDGSTWTLHQELTGSDTDAYDRFGFATAVDGHRMVIGASNADSLIGEAGAAYVFEDFGGLWVETAQLLPALPIPGSSFGKTLDIDGDRILVGAYETDLAHIFELQSGVWVEVAILRGLDTQIGDRFGYSVALSGDTALIGTPGDDDVASYSGAAYVFVRNGFGIWEEQAKLLASDLAGGDGLGDVVDLEDDLAVVGARAKDGVYENMGAVYLFERSGTTWIEVQKLEASDFGSYDYFGSSVALDGAALAIGANGDQISSDNGGSVYLFRSSGGSFTEQSHMYPAGFTGSELFGSDVAIQGDRILGGAPNYGYVNAPGASYIFECSTDSGGAYCFGDGSGTPCPCGVVGALRSGCPNTAGAGAELTASGDASIANDTFTVRVDYLPNTVGLFVQGVTALQGVPVGEGLLCLGPQKRYSPQAVSGGTVSRSGFSVFAHAGQTMNYTWWFRDPSNQCNGGGFNFANGWSVTWEN